MNVTFDISSIVYNRGVSRYTTNLVRALKKNREVQLELFGTSFRQKEKLHTFAKSLHLSDKEQHFFQIPPKVTSLSWYGFSFPPIDFFISKETDVFHAWEDIIPPSTVPIVATIHDLAILKYPETAHPDTLYKHSQGWKRLKNKQAHVIAVSQATKRDIIDLLDFPSDHVHTVYEALPQESALIPTKEDNDAVQHKYHLTRPFMLFVGTREPRKNLARLIEAWKPLAKEIDLVVVGAIGWNEDIDTRTERLKILGSVSDSDLRSLYAQATLFAYPSLYEGFGLPILEAFYFGTPVVTSNISSMPEVAGHAAELVDPMNEKSIRKGIENILNENSKDKHTRLQQMKVRLQLFSWEQTATKTIQVYKKAINQ